MHSGSSSGGERSQKRHSLSSEACRRELSRNRISVTKKRFATAFCLRYTPQCPSWISGFRRATQAATFDVLRQRLWWRTFAKAALPEPRSVSKRASSKSNIHCQKMLCIRLLPSIRPKMPFLDFRFSPGYSGGGFGERSQKRHSRSVRCCREPSFFSMACYTSVNSFFVLIQDVFKLIIQERSKIRLYLYIVTG